MSFSSDPSQLNWKRPVGPVELVPITQEPIAIGSVQGNQDQSDQLNWYHEASNEAEGKQN